MKEKTQTPSVTLAKTHSNMSAKKPSPVKSTSTVKTKDPSPTSSQPTVKVRQALQAAIKNRPSTFKPVAKATSRPSTMAKISASSSPQEASAKPGMSFSSSPKKQEPNATKRRIPSGAALSTSKPGFVPTKSVKPVTNSSFVLPGEAIAAKLKAQREERLKREEESAQDRPKQFKARPAPKMVARPSVAPKENKTSKARMSVASGGSNKENVSPRPAIVKASLNIQKARESKTTDTRANPSVRRTTQGICIPPIKASGPPPARIISLSNGEKSTVSKTEAAVQKAKGKAVFGRIKANVEQQDKEKREKEDAARKARAEAAERGRQASREWAEKQKKKMAETAAANPLAVATSS